MRSLVFAAAIAAVVVSASPAANWQPISESSNGKSAVAIDATSLGHFAGLTSAWFKTTYFETAGDGAADEKFMVVVDCVAHMLGTVSSVRHRNDGTVISSDNMPIARYRSSLEPVAPETMGEDMMHAVCKAPAPRHR